MLRMHRRSGQNSKIAGIVLAGLSLVFLILSVYFSDNIVLQIDSIASLLVAFAVFLRGDRNSVQIRIVNKIIESGTRSLDEVSTHSFGSDAMFSYVPFGTKLQDVFLVANSEAKIPAELEASTSGNVTVNPHQSNALEKTFVPPGRGLAELYARELSSAVSMENLFQSLQTIVCERFELASSLTVKLTEGNLIELTMNHPAIRQSCASQSTKGMIGCPVSSMLAVLFASASNRSSTVIRCSFNAETDILEISIGLGPKWS
jgi:hypothetical protein